MSSVHATRCDVCEVSRVGRPDGWIQVRITINQKPDSQGVRLVQLELDACASCGSEVLGPLKPHLAKVGAP
jgi:hypothetical protein